MAREIKLIWDDTDINNSGWFAREYVDVIVDDETDYTEPQEKEWQFDADRDAAVWVLLDAAGIKDAEGAEVEIYRSISRSIPDARTTV